MVVWCQVCARRVWHVPCLPQFIHSLCHVHVLRPVVTGTPIPEVPLVEEIHDQHADCEYPRSHANHLIKICMQMVRLVFLKNYLIVTSKSFKRSKIQALLSFR